MTHATVALTRNLVVVPSPVMFWSPRRTRHGRGHTYWGGHEGEWLRSEERRKFQRYSFLPTRRCEDIEHTSRHYVLALEALLHRESAARKTFNGTSVSHPSHYLSSHETYPFPNCAPPRVTRSKLRRSSASIDVRQS